MGKRVSQSPGAAPRSHHADRANILRIGLHTIPAAVDDRWNTVKRADRSCGENSSQKGAHHAANTVQLEDFEPVINSKPLIEILEQANHYRRDEANDDGSPWG